MLSFRWLRLFSILRIRTGIVLTRNCCGRLIVDSNFEPGRAPVHKLDAAFRLDCCYGSIYILGNYVSAVEKAACHVFTVAGIALHHLISRLETRIGDLCNSQLLVVGLLSRNDRGIRCQGEVNSGIGNQIGLELGEIHIERAVKPEGSCDWTDNLCNETIQIDVARPFDVKISPADVVDGFVVHHKSTVWMLQGGVGGQDGVVRLHDSSRHLRCWINWKLQLGLLSIINRQPLHEKWSETRTSSSTERVEDEEALESRTLISQLPDPVQNEVDDLFTDGVMASRIVIGGVFLSCDELLRVE